jgi:cellulose synthase/poly-beta-1,6-N-acetylglucosamine synthase-like glycosyltransferase
MLMFAVFLLGLNLVVCWQLLVLRRCLGQLANCGRWSAPSPAEFPRLATEDPDTAVILCVRGADPSLTDCLRGLAAQTHTNFTVHVVVDHQSDPACELLRQAAAGDERIFVHQIPGPPPNHRGLKVTAILHAIRQLPASVERVAFIDGDVIAHPDWLRQITAPLEDPEVGACTGTRWFVPEQATLGSLVRTEWNLYATAFMVRHRILWGGSFSMRAAELRSAVEQGVWEHKLCEDTCLGDYFRNSGRRTVMVPEVAMLNPETCGLGGAAAFIARQQIFTRLYSSAAPRIIGFGIAFTALCLLSPIFAAVALVAGPPAAGVISLAAYVLLHAAVVHLEWFGHQLPFRLRTDGGAECQGQRAPLWKLYVVQLLCAAISLFACLKAVFADRMAWRGIQYRIRRGPTRVEMLQYRPFLETRTRETLRSGAGQMSI